ncbi:spore germination protein [Solibacillus sp. FSL W7-1464]|uniref:spore germination protein n=1 Tax=Solibacillus sp. FSL W7-1464 TaxID=2921706 RepID=UPI0030F7B725
MFFSKKKKNELRKKQTETLPPSSQKKEMPEQASDKTQKSETISETTKIFIQDMSETVQSPADLVVRNVTEKITIMFVDNLIKEDILNLKLLPALQNIKNESPETIISQLPLPQINETDKMTDCVHTMLTGAVVIHVEGHNCAILVIIPARESRGLTPPENESQVIGSQVGFNESLSTNISLVRRYIANPNLGNEKFKVGKQTNTALSVMYIKGIVAEQNVNTIRQRIEALDIQDIIDSAELSELIDDNKLSLFPQMLITERPDRFCDGLLSGKVGILVDGSSMAILCPYSFFEFFQSREDKNLRWPIATFLRLLRFVAILISIFLTPLYVGALTFHYEVIPQSLLVPLSESRARVPFPPILEALFLELIMELLREAGARLPTKIGQTIGIVGGIVLGTAAVQAGITSNILIIIVALCALSSFITPSYMMGNVIRIIRFPIIIIAGFWGFYGIMLAFCILLIHLLRLTSLGAPYLSPFYPPRIRSWGDSIIRFPYRITIRKSATTRVDGAEFSSSQDGQKNDGNVKE